MLNSANQSSSLLQRIAICGIAIYFFLAVIPTIKGQEPQQLPSFKKATQAIQNSTVTLRIDLKAESLSKTESEKEPDSEEQDSENADEIAVFSGFYVGSGKLVTPLFLHPTKDIRITLPGGNQCLGKTLVMDEYAGLCLLSINDRTLTALEVADAEPEVGSFVLSGSGWGVYKPLVSFGIVSGHGHQLPNAHLPPLMACDVRTTRTSKGAPVINHKGELLGIVIAMTNNEDGRWTYAIPGKHIGRLQRAYRENFIDPKTGKEKEDVGVVVLPRRRPTVGMHLRDVKGKIVVVRIDDDGPAYKAGIRMGDRISKVEGFEIRSVYQVVRPVLSRQPGDEMEFTVNRENQDPKQMKVLLGGESTFKPSALADISKYVVPQIVLKKQKFETLPPRFPEQLVNTDGKEKSETELSEKELLSRAIEAYQAAIAFQQRRLMETEKKLMEAEKERVLRDQEIRDLQLKIKDLENK